MERLKLTLCEHFSQLGYSRHAFYLLLPEAGAGPFPARRAFRGQYLIPPGGRWPTQPDTATFFVYCYLKNAYEMTFGW